jgi:type IX secretion system PorP/SprF family membrane protein
MSQPYRTYSAFADFQVFRNRLDNGWLGLGGLLLGDVAGTGSLTSAKLYLSAAYHQMLGNSSLLSAGFNVGWASKRINISKLTFPDQFDGRFFDATRPTSVTLSNTGVDYPDIQVGLNYAYFPSTDIYLNAGYSAHHVNRPSETFFSDKSIDDIIPLRHIAFVNASLKAGSNIDPEPQYLFQYPGPCCQRCRWPECVFQPDGFRGKTNYCRSLLPLWRCLDPNGRTEDPGCSVHLFL